MRHVCVLLNFAVLALVGLLGSASSACVAGGSCNGPSNCWSDNCVCRCCNRCCCWCDKACQFRLIDGCTKCAWSRTWHASYALDTPLRQYYIPRPPQCCWCGHGAGQGYVSGASWDVPGGTNCPNHAMVAGCDLSADGAMAFAADQSERLGKIPNELDVLGSVGGGAPARVVPVSPDR